MLHYAKMPCNFQNCRNCDCFAEGQAPFTAEMLPQIPVVYFSACLAFTGVSMMLIHLRVNRVHPLAIIATALPSYIASYLYCGFVLALNEGMIRAIRDQMQDYMWSRVFDVVTTVKWMLHAACIGVSIGTLLWCREPAPKDVVENIRNMKKYGCFIDTRYLWCGFALLMSPFVSTILNFLSISLIIIVAIGANYIATIPIISFILAVSLLAAMTMVFVAEYLEPALIFG